MSNRLFQSVIHQMRDAVDKTIGVIDESGAVISCSDLSKIGEVRNLNISSVFSSNSPVAIDNCTYQSFGTHVHPECAAFIEGTDDLSKGYLGMLCVSLASIKQYYDEKYDRSNFVKNIILDNILPGDIYLKARELHFNNEASRVVILIRLLDKNDVFVYDVIQNLFPDKSKDFVINISESDIALVKEVKSDIESKDLEKLARSISDALTLISIGTTVTGVKDLARSFKEAQVALEVGKVFDTERNIVSYEHLGIARLIYQLPTTLCEMFLKEIFKVGSIETLDQETLFTIQRFFENNLNVSETSRKLFVHRNTLVYRLEKIKKLTGLDLREFDDAIVFKVALMVKKYLEANPVKY